MAFTYDPNLTADERRKQQQEAQQSGGPVGSGTPGGTVSAPKQPSSSTGGTQSGQFTNLQKYITANQPKQFGSQVAQKVEGDLTSAGQEQQSAAGQFRDQVGQNTVAYDEGLANEAKTNAAQVAGDESKRSQFERMRDAQYRGPQQLADVGEAYTRATSATQNAQKAAEATGSEEGQRALLGKYYGRPTYSRGETSLDQLLVKGDASAQPKFEQARQQGQQLGTQFQTLQQQLGGEAQQAAQQTDATRQRLQNEFLGEQGAYGQFRNTLQSQADQAKQAAEAARQDRLNKIAQGQAPDQNLAGQDIYNLDMSKYYSAQNPTLAQAANQEQAANFGALSQLLGQNNDVFTDPSQVGTFNPNQAVQFNEEQFRKDQSDIAQQYQNAINEQNFEGYTMAEGSGMIGANASKSKQKLEDAIKNTQATLNDPRLKPGRKQELFAQLQNLLGQQKAIQQQYGVGKVLK